MKDRIAKIIKKEQLTSQQFAEIIEIQSSTISHILAGRNLPSFKIISNLLERFPKISPDWLIFGKGEMYREEEKPSILGNYSVNNAIFTNINQEEVPDEKISRNLAIDEVQIEEEKEVSDVLDNAVNEDKNGTITSSIPIVVAEKIIIMYSDKSFEIFNSK